MLTISGQHVALLAAVTFVVHCLSAVPMLFRRSVKLGLVWLYIFVPGTLPSTIHARGVTTFVLAASSSEAKSHLCSKRIDNPPKVRFSFTVGEEPIVEVALV